MFIRSSMEARARSVDRCAETGASNAGPAMSIRATSVRIMGFLKSGSRYFQAAEYGVDARQQHIRVERFQHVVVGAQLEHAALDAGSLFRGEHDDRQSRERHVLAKVRDRLV